MRDISCVRWTPMDGPLPPACTRALGRCGPAMLADHSVVVAWLGAGEGDHARPCVQRVHAGGERDLLLEIADVAADRSTGFPTIAALGDRAPLAWTDVAARRVRTAVLSFD